jgi:hypothetical protein
MQYNNQPFQEIENLLYFSNKYSEHQKKYCTELLRSTWEIIPTDDQIQIERNLEFIICKQVEDCWRNDTPACTLFSKISQRNFIIFNPFSGDLKIETYIHILAHEFAHVLYDHPKIGSKKRMKNMGKFVS